MTSINRLITEPAPQRRKHVGFAVLTLAANRFSLAPSSAFFF